jgi:hypothetical protein
MTSFAANFRAQAKRERGNVIRRYVRGWSFCLSYGPVDPLIAADVAADVGIRVEHRGRDVTDEVMERLKTAPEDPKYQKDAEELKDEWMFSAKLYPLGRSSTTADWEYLGKMVAALGAPAKVPDSVYNAPNESHYWIWRDS